MIRRTCLLFICLFAYVFSNAQTDTNYHLRVSLLTCGVGDDLYASFGHTGVRVIDSSKHTDIVYNYGTFDFGDPNFYMKFTRGKLLYFISSDDFNSFMQEYIVEKRTVQEQVFLLPAIEKHKIDSFIRWNMLPQNMYYKYDFLFDNCATRIRDIFPNVLKDGFQFGFTMPDGKEMTFRQIINQYLYRKQWESFGINLLLGSRIDKIMTNRETMFLPDFLRNGIANGTVNGRPISSEPETILPGSPMPPAGLNGPLIVNIIIALLVIIGVCFKPLRVLGKVMSSLLLLITGLLGIFMLFMWFGTDHQACQDNLNILWALPTNVILVFNVKGKSRYALIAIVLVLVSLLLHLLKIQELPLLQLFPLLIALLFIYGSIYKRGSLKAKK